MRFFICLSICIISSLASMDIFAQGNASANNNSKELSCGAGGDEFKSTFPTSISSETCQARIHGYAPVRGCVSWSFEGDMSYCEEYRFESELHYQVICGGNLVAAADMKCSEKLEPKNSYTVELLASFVVERLRQLGFQITTTDGNPGDGQVSIFFSHK